MKKINRTLLIGLGGAGKDIVTSVKRNYKESDSSLIEYLVIDTDSIGLNEGDLTRNEIVDIGFNNGKGIVDNNPLIKRWVPKKAEEMILNHGFEADAGSGQDVPVGQRRQRPRPQPAVDGEAAGARPRALREAGAPGPAAGVRGVQGGGVRGGRVLARLGGCLGGRARGVR